MRAAAIAVIVCSSACTQARPFECISSEQCVQGTLQGTCEPSGACSFPDESCPSGQRFDDGAGGQCVDDARCGAVGEACCDGVCDEGASCEDDVCVAAPTCGGVGQPCCAADECGVNAWCESGTCQQCVVDVAHGRRHGCAVRYDGSVWCWGENISGQLGDGTQNGSPSPVQVALALGGEPLADVTHVSAGSRHTCALRTDSTVWCWGEGEAGNLGNGASVDSPTPVQVIVESDLQPLANVVDLAVGGCNTCARTQDRRVWCWGCGDSGRLGSGATANRAAAAPVLTEAGGTELGGVEQLGVDDHACVRRSDDGIWCWGPNGSGELGNGTTTASTVAIPVFSGVDLAVGRFITCVSTDDGSAWCWGDEWRGRAGAGGPSPTQILHASGALFTGVRAVAAGSVSCALAGDGRAWCWGTSNYGQTGTGASGPTPGVVLQASGDGPLHGVERLVAGNAHVCAFGADGSLLCWGRNVQGDLGDGTRINRGFPTPLALQCE